MSLTQQHDELTQAFNLLWADRTPVDWANVQFDMPANGSWARFRILDGDSNQLTIGATTNSHRHVGVIVVSLFTELGKGDATIIALADIVADGFRNWIGSYSHCRQPSIKEIGPDGQGWYQINVSIPFSRDELY